MSSKGPAVPANAPGKTVSVPGKPSKSVTILDETKNNPRREELEKAMESMNLSNDVKRLMQLKLQQEETTRKLTQKLNVSDFDLVAIIGRGAFGEVRVVRKKDDKKIYAMKVMKKN